MPDLEKVARDFVAACLRREFLAAHAHASPVLTSGVPEFIMAETWNRVSKTAGDFKQVASVRSYRHLLAPLKAVIVVCDFERTVVEVHLTFDPSDLVIGMALLTPGLE